MDCMDCMCYIVTARERLYPVVGMPFLRTIRLGVCMRRSNISISQAHSVQFTLQPAVTTNAGIRQCHVSRCYCHASDVYMYYDYNTLMCTCINQQLR